MNELKTAYKYVEDVLGEKIPTSKYVKLACNQFVSLREHGKDNGIFFDEKAAQRILTFYDHIRHHKGDAGRNKLSFQLSDWQAFATSYTFGFKRDDGRRLVQESYIEVAKKNGKTAYSAGTCGYGLMSDGEAGAEIYIAAPSRDQANIAFTDCKEFLGNSKFAPHLKIMRNAIKYKTNNFITAVSSEAGNLEGKFGFIVLLDELHEHKTSEVYDNLKTGMIARSSPLMMSITTAGYDKESFCFQRRNALIRNLENYFVPGETHDSKYLCLIYTLDEGDNYEDETLWGKSNPQIGKSIRYDAIRSEIDSIKIDPSKYVSVITKHMNIWVDAPKVWISRELWETCNHGEIDWDEFRGCRCWGGLDLSQSDDLTAYVLFFEKDGKYYIKPRFYVVEKKAKELYDKQIFNFFPHRKTEYCRIMDNEATDYNIIIEDIKTDLERFNIQFIGYDPYNSSSIQKPINDLLGNTWDFEQKKYIERFEKVVQNKANMSPAIKEFYRWVKLGDIRHDGNLILAWCIRNTIIKTDWNDNWYPHKESDNNKIDGTMALADAIRTYMLHEWKQNESVYKERGIIQV